MNGLVRPTSTASGAAAAGAAAASPSLFSRSPTGGLRSSSLAVMHGFFGSASDMVLLLSTQPREWGLAGATRRAGPLPRNHNRDRANCV